MVFQVQSIQKNERKKTQIHIWYKTVFAHSTFSPSVFEWFVSARHAHTQVETDEWISIGDGVKSPHEFQVHAKKKCVFRVISQHSTNNRVCNFTRMFHFTSTLSYQNIIPLFFDIGLVWNMYVWMYIVISWIEMLSFLFIYINFMNNNTQFINTISRDFDNNYH